MKLGDSPDQAATLRALERQELTLGELGSILWTRKWIVFGIPLVAGAAALAAVLLIKNQWEGSGIIQIGRIGGQPGVAPDLIEPAPRTLERLAMRSFEDAVLGSLKMPIDGPVAQLYRTSKSARHLHTDLIEIKLRGYAPDDAQKLVEASAAALTRRHQSIAEPSIERMRQALQRMRSERDRFDAERERLQQAINRLPGASPADRVVMLNNAMWLTLLLQDLDRRAAELEEQLSTQRTYATSLFADVQVSAGPVRPRRTLIVILTVLIGTVLGVAVALLMYAGRRARLSV